VTEKRLFWVGSSLEDIRAFPKAARFEVGHQLHLVQLGLQPDDWRPMPSVGPGVYEIRIHSSTEYRVFYVAKFAEAVYVLHAFEKQSQKTRQSDIELGKKRLSDVRNQREGR
jgi:phage-related protein